MKDMWLFILTILILSSIFMLTFGLGILSVPLGISLFIVALFALGVIYKKINGTGK